MRECVGVLTLLTVVVALSTPSAARAGYFSDESEAVHITRGHLHNLLDYHYTVARCRPQGLDRPVRGYVYHRWVCAWAAGDSRYEPSCFGQSLVAGSHAARKYYWRVDHHEGRCPKRW